MIKHHINEIMRYKALRMKMLGQFEDRYFQDMTFKQKNILNKMASSEYFLKGSSGKTEKYTDDSWTSDFTLRHWLIAYSGKKYKLDKIVVGQCFSNKKLIVIKSNKKQGEEDNVILHEMIHAYESILPESLKQFLLLYLYKNLEKKLGYKKLWKLINTDSHIDMRVHTPLFMLKSLDLDLHTKQPLGTIYGYQRNKYFK